MTDKTLNQLAADAKLSAALAMLDRTFVNMKAENASARARRTPAEQKAWEMSLKASGTWGEYSDSRRPSDEEFDYRTAQAGSGYYA